MIYGFAYLAMVIAISAGWLLLAVLKKPEFIEVSKESFEKRWHKARAILLTSK